MSPPDETVIVESVRIPSGDRVLEGRLAYPNARTPIGCIVIAGPHPQLGGHVDNNLVNALTLGLSSRNIATLAFNYREAVDERGKPSSKIRQLEEFWKTSRVNDEQKYADDFKAAVEIIRTMIGPRTPMALVGYSFGCSILPSAKAPSKIPLVLIAPTVGKHDYDAFFQSTNPMLVISSHSDFAIDLKLMLSWFDRLSTRKRIVRGDWDNHFFRGHEERITEIVFEFLREQWEVSTCS